MKKSYIFGLMCLMFLLYIALGGCDDRSEDEKMVHKAIYTTAKTLNDRYQLHYMGIVEAGDKEHYKKIGLFFELMRIINKEEGRKIIVNCAQELLKEINSNPNLLPYLLPSPFPVENIELAIYIRHPDGQSVYHPDLAVISLRKGVIRYSTDTPEMRRKLGFYTEEKETYEEALKILKSETASS